jgi:hypothetical protein
MGFFATLSDVTLGDLNAAAWTMDNQTSDQYLPVATLYRKRRRKDSTWSMESRAPKAGSLAEWAGR